MTVRDMISELRERLAPVVGDAEARAMAYIIIEDIKGYTRTQIIMYDQRELLPETVERMRQIAKQVTDGVPLQYALGCAHWRGRQFSVSPGVLIPRPETAQLVDMIIDAYGHVSDCRILDIGTGSGCIAVSLALDIPFSKVDAIDISPVAADIAAKNAKALRAKVNISVADAFSLFDNADFVQSQYDVIVSNPPYILESERHTLDKRVSEHEPPTALFVGDSEPIAIYKAISDFAAAHLVPGGGLFLEINPLCVDLITAYLTSLGMDNVISLRDYKGNIRFITCKR